MITPLDEAALERIAAVLERAGAEAIAISFVKAYANPAHEQRAAALLRARLPGRFVTTGTDLTRE